MTCGVYTIINITNNKQYIGSSLKIESRWKAHIRLLNKNKHHSRHLQEAWFKYGETNFKFAVLLKCAPHERVIYEQKAIDKFKTILPAFGYNVRPDASGGNGMSEETKQKISAALLGKLRGPKTEEQKLKQSLSQLGRKQSEETKQKISKAHTGKRKKPLTEEHKEKLRQSTLARTFTEEQKLEISKKITQSKKGKPGSSWTEEQRQKILAKRLGSKRTEETKQKMRDSAKQQWVNRKKSD